MILYLLRHGETDWNVKGLLQGHQDVPMNENGERQIRMIGYKLCQQCIRPDLIISSPLSRAKKAAMIVAETIGYAGEIVTEDLLIERSFGSAEGLALSPRDERFVREYRAESEEELLERAEKALRKTLERGENSRVLLVAHGAILGAALTILKYGEDLPEHPLILSQGEVRECVVAGTELKAKSIRIL